MHRRHRQTPQTLGNDSLVRPYGVYQIGEDQARSCCVIGTSGDILMPKRSWS